MGKPNLDAFNEELKQEIERLKKKHGLQDHETTTWRINLVEKKLLKNKK